MEAPLFGMVLALQLRTSRLSRLSLSVVAKIQPTSPTWVSKVPLELALEECPQDIVQALQMRTRQHRRTSPLLPMVQRLRLSVHRHTLHLHFTTGVPMVPLLPLTLQRLLRSISRLLRTRLRVQDIRPRVRDTRRPLLLSRQRLLNTALPLHGTVQHLHAIVLRRHAIALPLRDTVRPLRATVLNPHLSALPLHDTPQPALLSARHLQNTLQLPPRNILLLRQSTHPRRRLHHLLPNIHQPHRRIPQRPLCRLIRLLRLNTAQHLLNG